MNCSLWLLVTLVLVVQQRKKGLNRNVFRIYTSSNNARTQQQQDAASLLMHIACRHFRNGAVFSASAGDSAILGFSPLRATLHPVCASEHESVAQERTVYVTGFLREGQFRRTVEVIG